MLTKKLKITKIATAVALTAIASTANAGYKIKLSDGDAIEFGGYIKVDARYVSGEVAYKDFWTGGGTAVADSSQFKIHAKESRFNTKYTHGDVTGFLEFDMYLSGQGNEKVSNSYSPRLRHAFVKYDKWLLGQTWSTFMNTSAIPESADFAAATAGIVFNRQGQIRYTNGGLQLSIENPETWGTDDNGNAASTTDDFLPDFVARYNLKGDWGNVSFAAVFQQVDSEVSDETGLGYSVAGKINVGAKDDFKFQVNAGQSGRYVGAGSSSGLVNGKYEDQLAYSVAYRHFWNSKGRSSIYMGGSDGELTNNKRHQIAVNYFTNITKKLSVGVEYGQFTLDNYGSDKVSSDYLQFAAKFVL